MEVDGLHNYIQFVTGMSKGTRSRAVGAAKSLLAQTGLNDAAADANVRITKLAEELLAASKANRDLLQKLIRVESDKAAARLGFVRVEDLQALRTEIAELRRLIEDRAARETTGIKVSPATEPPPTTAPSRRAAAKRAAARKGAAKAAATTETSASADAANPEL